MNKEHILATYFEQEDEDEEHTPRDGYQIELDGEVVDSITMEDGEMVVYTNQDRESFHRWEDTTCNDYSVYTLTLITE